MNKQLTDAATQSFSSLSIKSAQKIIKEQPPIVNIEIRRKTYLIPLSFDDVTKSIEM